MQSNKLKSLTVLMDRQGDRLDFFLASSTRSHSRSFWKQLIIDGVVLVNGQTAKPNYKVRANDCITWILPEERALEDLPEKIDFSVMYEDASLLVLNKPPGLVVHPAVGHEGGTLLNGLLYHDASFGELERAGLVHRLDKDTSGVMVVAKSESALSELKRQFKAREVRKEYIALVWGGPPEKGRIETLIGRHPNNRKKMGVLNEGGRHAVSVYERVEQFEKIALMRIKIETGRTHQIRVHMSHLGHPVVGDRLYGRARKCVGLTVPGRQMLHAFRLSLTHPASGKRLSFEGPLHEDMHLFLDALRGNDFGGK